MEKFFTATCVYKLRHLPSSRRIVPLTTEYVYKSCRREFLHFTASRASIFLIFFFNWPKISHRFHFFILEHSIMQSKGRTARTTVSRTVLMNTGRVVGESLPIKTRNSPILKSKIRLF